MQWITWNFLHCQKHAFYDLNINEVLYQVGHTTDQKRHLMLIRFRIFKMRWTSVANDHLGPKPPISDSATRRSLWPLQCQPVALDDEWQISKTISKSFHNHQNHTGHEYRKMDYGTALRCGCSCENCFVSKRWHPSFNIGDSISMITLKTPKTY